MGPEAPSDRPPTPTFRGVFVIVAICVIFACMAVVFFSNVRRRTREEACRLNLALLSIEILRASPSDARRWDAVATGSRFWTDHATWPSIPVRPIRPQMLVCPAWGRTKPGTGTDYRGPAQSIRSLAPEAPIGADRPGNHGPGRGGNVLLRSGEIREVAEADALWETAARTTCD